MDRPPKELLRSITELSRCCSVVDGVGGRRIAMVNGRGSKCMIIGGAKINCQYSSVYCCEKKQRGSVIHRDDGVERWR